MKQSMPTMIITYEPIYAHPLSAYHSFPMQKHELIPAQSLHEGIIKSEQLFSPKPSPFLIVSTIHTIEYGKKIVGPKLYGHKQRKMGFPQSMELIQI